MNSFEVASLVEKKALTRLEPLIREESDGRYVLTSKGRLAPFIQEVIGDVIWNDRNGRMWTVEIKAEEENNFGNLFLETWSNRNLEDPDSHARRGSNAGWLFKVQGDLLFYYFIKCDSLYIFNVLGLKRWAFGYGENQGRIYQYREKPQSKYSQRNDTWGRCVPISVLISEVSPKPKLIHPRQFDFWPEKVRNEPTLDY